jgi:RNA polymerase sigma-70 factor (ECF subfamily)
VIDPAPSRHQVTEVLDTTTGGIAPGLRSKSASERDRAWRVLYEEHVERIYRLVCKFGVEPGEVEDVTQKTFVIAHQRLQEIDDVENVGAWLRGIAVKVIGHHRRWHRVRRLKSWVVQATFGEDAKPPPMTPEGGVASQEEQGRVRSILAEMSPKLREVLVMTEMEECQPAEVAEVLGIPVNTVRSRKRLAKEEFQRLWGERYGAK